jgi:hypothetical protein
MHDVIRMEEREKTRGKLVISYLVRFSYLFLENKGMDYNS